MSNSSDTYTKDPQRYEAAKVLANLGGGDLHAILKEKYFAMDALEEATRMVKKEEAENAEELLAKLEGCYKTLYPSGAQKSANTRKKARKEKKNVRDSKILAG